MKVMLVNGSPHEHGCTAAALDVIAKTLKEEGIETELFWLGTEPIGGCISCRACAKLGKCAFEGKVTEFAEKAKTADGFIFGSPVHYAALSGNMASFMDRLFFSTPGEVFCHKPAAGIISARRGGTTAAYEQFNKYFGISQMPIVSSRYWNMVHGSKAEDVLKDEEGVTCMKMLARNMAYLLKCRAAADAAGVPLPKQEPFAKTNFIR